EEGEEITDQLIQEAIYQVEKAFVRRKILDEGMRSDRRSLDQIRPLECMVGVLPRTHGSAVFTRGQTQSLSVITLGTSSDEQTVESFAGRQSKHFMLHYSFPPFSVGEVKPLRGPSRREIGHGALAEKSLINLLPDKDKFPYTIRVVSEVLESNGSSSMATVCAASLSLMDAGVPLKDQVAGIAIGIVTEGERYVILTDIAGEEDHYGDMDFKIAATKKGIMAIQLDVKNDGLTFLQIEEALKRGRQACVIIIDKMNSVLPSPRKDLSLYAPKIETVPIGLDKIGEFIGPGGKNIRRLIRKYNVEIDIDDESGRVFIVAEDMKNLKEAVAEIESSLREVVVGDIYEAKVVKLTNFGAFCEIAPGKSGLLHISELSDGFVKDVRDFLKEGDKLTVKVIKIDAQGRVDLSRKQAE
ncbi:MAG: polyribonucleotide nucleotidyltransferase, partial [Candidatus Omnitrophota bacterium]